MLIVTTNKISNLFTKIHYTLAGGVDSDLARTFNSVQWPGWKLRSPLGHLDAYDGRRRLISACNWHRPHCIVP
jgi:hypothetical protein